MPAHAPQDQTPARGERPRLAWGLTGSGHWLRETLDFILTLDDVDLFLTRAAAEVLGNYGYRQEALRERVRIYQDHTASSVPVGFLYDGNYHTLVVGPATSNTVAKCVAGISDTLVTNLYAQAGKCRIPAIVFACDTRPTVITEAPGRMVTLHPRPVDLDNTARLARYPLTSVVDDLEALQAAVHRRLSCLSTSCS